MSEVRVLFLSYQSSHTEIFLNVVKELKKICPVSYKILNSRDVINRPITIRNSYVNEVRKFNRIVDEASPDIFVIANDLGLSSTFMRICKRRGVPTIAIQDGLLSADNWGISIGRFLALRRYLPWRVISAIANSPVISNLTLNLGLLWEVPVCGTGGTSAIAAMGDYYKQVLISKGVKPERIVITGYPLFDKVCNYKPAFSRKVFCDKMALNSAAPLILLISQPFTEDGYWKKTLKDSLLDFVVNGVKQVNGQLVVKLHPREDKAIYEKLIRDHPEIKIVLIRDCDLDTLLLLADSVMTVSSTVGLWAMAHGKRLIVLNCFPNPSKNILEDIGLPVKNLQEFVKLLNRCINETKLSSSQNDGFANISDHVYKLDGKASERIAKLLLSMVSDSCKERP